MVNRSVVWFLCCVVACIISGCSGPLPGPLASLDKDFADGYAYALIASSTKPQTIVPTPPLPTPPKPDSDKCTNCNGTGKVGDGRVFVDCSECGGDGVMGLSRVSVPNCKCPPDCACGCKVTGVCLCDNKAKTQQVNTQVTTQVCKDGVCSPSASVTSSCANGQCSTASQTGTPLVRRVFSGGRLFRRR